MEVVGDRTAVGTEGGGLFLAPFHYWCGKLNKRLESSFWDVEERVVFVMENIAVMAEHGGGRVVQVPNLTE